MSRRWTLGHRSESSRYGSIPGNGLGMAASSEVEPETTGSSWFRTSSFGFRIFRAAASFLLRRHAILHRVRRLIGRLLMRQRLQEFYQIVELDLLQVAR